MVYPLSVVLAVAKKHCFYDENVTHPPTREAVDQIVQQTAHDDKAEQLAAWPLLHKETLYTTIQRLVNDTSPENTYRQSSYVSITGGGRGAQPLFFATDGAENRRQRAEFGSLIASTGTLSSRDWVVSMHSGGGLYRALDLTLEIMECAGACTLAAGSHMPLPDVVQLLIKYHANAVSGDSSQIVNLARHVATLPPETRRQIRLDKIVYTSEVLTRAQRAFLRATLGNAVAVCSLLASAESGPWALSNPALTGDGDGDAATDFVYDTRTMLVEIFPDQVGRARPLPDGATGMIVLTSLCRLRNPLVRYVSGDVGSLHELPAAVAVDRAHLRVLRLQGRDRRFSFDWEGDYIEFRNLAAIADDPRYGLLQWQAILQNGPQDLLPCLELRVLPSGARDKDLEAALLKHMAERVRVLLSLEGEEESFCMRVLENTDGFEKSTTGRKVVKFIDRFNERGDLDAAGKTEGV
ncbi:hypothetical protein A9K55_005524 [Cordyceps militaris]|uniref:Uncharacterized protein n=1 Tax=Cordyceps militaris TaxID=73501 RepID=A0A2H4SCQ5_CORMI|nr:hypothetical protein A9K55_005524 [Cordyceps militaris]